MQAEQNFAQQTGHFGLNVAAQLPVHVAKHDVLLQLLSDQIKDESDRPIHAREYWNIILEHVRRDAKKCKKYGDEHMAKGETMEAAAEYHKWSKYEDRYSRMVEAVLGGGKVTVDILR